MSQINSNQTIFQKTLKKHLDSLFSVFVENVCRLWAYRKVFLYFEKYFRKRLLIYVYKFSTVTENLQFERVPAKAIAFYNML